MDRRRSGRFDTRTSLERALSTWRRLGQAWSSVFQAARAVKNRERMALAESKLDECRSEISRLESLLHPPPHA